MQLFLPRLMWRLSHRLLRASTTPAWFHARVVRHILAEIIPVAFPVQDYMQMLGVLSDDPSLQEQLLRAAQQVVLMLFFPLMWVLMVVAVNVIEAQDEWRAAQDTYAGSMACLLAGLTAHERMRYAEVAVLGPDARLGSEAIVGVGGRLA